MRVKVFCGRENEVPRFLCPFSPPLRMNVQGRSANTDLSLSVDISHLITDHTDESARAR